MRVSPFHYVKQTIKRQQELNELVRAKTQQAQVRQKRHFDKHCKGPKAYEVGDWVWVFCRIIPAGGTAKLLRGWRGPFRITEVHQAGRYYHLSSVNKAHYEILKPHFSGIEEFEVSPDVEDAGEIQMNPKDPEIDEKLITDDLSVDEVEVEEELQPFEMEDLNHPPDEMEFEKNNEPDAPLTMQMRGRKNRRSYNSEDSESSISETDDQRSYSLPPTTSDEEYLHEEEDLDETQAAFTQRPVPGFQEIFGDLFESRRQKKKGYPYALAHCISADAVMGDGIVVTFCQHFKDLRRGVESESSRRGSLIAILEEADQCWIYNLVTKDLCFQKPKVEDIRESLVLMREHALLNGVLEIHMPRLAAGLDRVEWNTTKQMLL